MVKIPIVPGRGLVTQTATQLRLDYMRGKNLPALHISESSLDLLDIRNNIESYVGSIELPSGLVGPLLMDRGNRTEEVYSMAATLEGALVASMNRGAKVISKSGGFHSKVHWQKMIRVPMFLFHKNTEAAIFTSFAIDSIDWVKKEVKNYSNHATLVEVIPVHIDEAVHLRFVYQTGDAAGQNMTTTCTWHTIQSLLTKFKEQQNITPYHYVIEGNGSSDKKVATYNIDQGRGIRVSATVHVPETIIVTVLRTSSEKLLACYHASQKIADKNGMLGYNINVTNAIAAIFAATGQDLASIHESGVGFLQLHQQEDGLLFELTLTNLVIGTVGGGTSLPKQQEALKLMDCYGTGKVQRFAQLIAGFALGLEISTYAAIVSGEFAKAHEKLGRNKPRPTFILSELNSAFLTQVLESTANRTNCLQIQKSNTHIKDNGILANISSKTNKKQTGIFPYQIQWKNSKATTEIVLKIKPLDTEVLKGIHLLSASIDPSLSDLFKEHKEVLEYHNCHQKELEMYEYLNKEKFPFMPEYFGQIKQEKKELYVLMLKNIEGTTTKLLATENAPQLWSCKTIKNSIKAISTFHQMNTLKDFAHLETFKPWEANSLYHKLVTIMMQERLEATLVAALESWVFDVESLRKESAELQEFYTCIHNDFNPRNIAITIQDAPIIYDWELIVKDILHRDIVEFLSFVLEEGFSKENLYDYLYYHFSLFDFEDWELWKKGYVYAIKSYIITRVSFYEVAGILYPYPFSRRVLKTALNMLAYVNDPNF